MIKCINHYWFSRPWGRLRSFFLNIYHFHNFRNVCFFGRRVNIEGNVCIDKNVILGDNVEVRNRTKHNSSIGKGTSINRNSVLRGYFTIGNNCAIAPNCTIVGFNHGFSDIDIPIKKQKRTIKGICIEDDVWIGANSIILDGTTIGKGTIIGGGSVVTKNIPPYSIAVGNPCKVIRTRITNQQ